ncbi:hypothetical protein HMPREF9565_00396 [Cutibacterium acnes HL053PA2]|nr:hypothetical protein HMPREF9575_00710 [Cutibacterium acnes HL110PA1]EFT07399.1 hypothetical protein HMPREF9618_01549 [Cutibacterium acnes HL082PA1]EFT51422.1 hypothetical protein HMPREF9565_00396 [Cutibacterium acnes HL053PA2]
MTGATRGIKVRTASTHPRPTRKGTRRSPGDLHSPQPRRRGASINA